MKVEQVCEVCGKRKAMSITHNKETDAWKFCCSSCWEDGYYVAFDQIANPPHEKMNWVEHMQKKGWVDMEQFLPRFFWVESHLRKST